jgi:hypothetical protein
MAKVRAKLKLTAPLPKEYDEQWTLFRKLEWREKEYPALKLCFATLNGLVIGPAQAMRAKRAGLKPGVPDIVLPVPRGSYHGLFIELKRRDERIEPSELQVAWLDNLTAQGYLALCCHGADDAEKTILNYLGGE